MNELESLRATLRWSTVIWAAIALFGATQTVFVMRAQGMQHAWIALYATQFLAWLPWAAATPFVLALGERFRIERPTAVAVATHTAACAALDVVAAAWVALLERLLDPWANADAETSFLPLWIEHLFTDILQSFFLYAAVLAAGYILRSWRRFAQQRLDAALMREALTRAQLDALRRQIEPHFLFNTLNSAVALMREGRIDAAVDTVVALSDVLRRLIENSPQQEISLGEELDCLKQYLAIQKIRFADRLRVEIEVPEALLKARVPCLVLQPLVENAIQHGIAACADAGRVRLTAACVDGHLHLAVYNDGPALASSPAQSGIGLTNVRTRLQHLYGDAFVLDLHDVPSRGVEAALSLPFRAGA